MQAIAQGAVIEQTTPFAVEDVGTFVRQRLQQPCSEGAAGRNSLGTSNFQHRAERLGKQPERVAELWRVACRKTGEGAPPRYRKVPARYGVDAQDGDPAVTTLPAIVAGSCQKSNCRHRLPALPVGAGSRYPTPV
jgi:hypothetical protein